MGWWIDNGFGLVQLPWMCMEGSWSEHHPAHLDLESAELPRMNEIGGD